MEVILKFFENDQPNAENSTISRTMGKIAVIERSYAQRAATGKAKMPLAQEFWRCRLVKELDKGKRSGAWLVKPIEQVLVDDLLHLIPSMYDSTINQGKMVITPKEEYKHKNCILPLDHKHMFMTSSGAYCILVDVTRPIQDKPRYSKDNPYGGQNGV